MGRLPNSEQSARPQANATICLLSNRFLEKDVGTASKENHDHLETHPKATGSQSPSLIRRLSAQYGCSEDEAQRHGCCLEGCVVICMSMQRFTWGLRLHKRFQAGSCSRVGVKVNALNQILSRGSIRCTAPQCGSTGLLCGFAGLPRR